jgi:hypothetical protein
MILPQQPNGAIAPPVNTPPPVPLQMGAPQAPQDRMGRFQQWSQLFNNPNSPITPLVNAWMAKMQHDQGTTQPQDHKMAQQQRLRNRSTNIGQSVDINRTMG